MKVEVGYAYYEGNAQVWDTLYVPIRRAIKDEDGLGETAVADLAQEAALLALEQRDDPDPIVGTFLIGIDEYCVVECPKCGGWATQIVRVAYATDGKIVTLDPPDPMEEYEMHTLPPEFYDSDGAILVDKIWVACAGCRHEALIEEFVPDW